MPVPDFVNGYGLAERVRIGLKELEARSSSSLLNSTAQVKKKRNFASKTKLNKYQQDNIDKSSDSEATSILSC